MQSNVLVEQQPVPMAVPPRHVWTGWQRVLFRFAFIFWGQFCVDDALRLCLWFWPWLRDKLIAGADWPINHLVLWVGKRVFSLTGEAATFHPTGSGDTALGWTEALVLLVLALLGGAVWSAVSEIRKRRFEYHTLYAWLRLLMRFALAGTLFSYGFEKVFPLQFPFPGVESLGKTYGGSSPMGLLWRFMGFSTVYRIFGGLAEVIPGLLLLFRRTTTVGALLAAAVMANVVVLNFGYDVPVKLYSSELLLMSLFLLLPDALPIWRFFFVREQAKLQGVWLPRAERRPLRIATRCVQALTIGSLLFSTGWSSYQYWRSSHTPLTGAWAIDSAQGEPATRHWARLSVRSASVAQVGPAGDLKYLDVKVDTTRKVLQFLGGNDSKTVAELHWDTEQDGKLTLNGTWSGAPASLQMHRITAPPTPLETRGFHWVQEYPYNK